MTQDSMQLKDWRFSVDGEGIAWAIFDREGESANALGKRPIEELMAIVEKVEAEARAKTVRGLVIMSGKERTFIVGADIREFENFTTEQQVIEMLKPVNGMLDRIERLPVPVVAAIHGVCVGGGLELILACHYRIATRDDGTRVGFPEVKLGIFPGFNGTARSIKQVGPMAAMQNMLTGGMIRAGAAKALGFLDQLVGSPGELRWAARKAVLQNRKSTPAGAAKMFLTKWPARGLLAKKMREETAKKARRDHYPAPFALIDLFEKEGGNLDAMKAAETKAFAPLMVSDTSRNLRRVFRLTELLKGQAPKGLKWKPSRVHVIGAGTMGADIAGVCVAAGMEVTLQDINADQLAKGIASQGKLFGRKFKTRALKAAAKTRLIADPEGRGIAQADVIIEAIVERLDIKQKLFADLETKIKPGAVLATNTSSLKLADISAPMKDPSRLIGLHFFSPVPQMPLVEVVRGAATSEDEVKKGAAFVTAIDKFPLITKDVPGFLVNKVLTPYMFAAMERLEKGDDKDKIDEAARAFGMPMGPIELADSVGLDVCAHVAKILGQSSEGSRLERLVASGRLGKKTGEGFYVWKEGKPVKSGAQYSKAELEKLGRELVAPMVAESQKSLDEGVVENADLVDAGMIFGTGFAPFRGGPLHYQKSQLPPDTSTRAAAE
ncbi:MAG: 3-hydroxyacyl-CoA dehydrogenase [Hyphomicrobium sp.]|nr:3-hydroxyacyl-CoA dehydrogenase [Hyphomicrobium sp.]